MNSLRSLGDRDRGFKSHLRNGYLVHMCVYFVCAVLYLGRILTTGRSLAHVLLPLVQRLQDKVKILDTDRVRYKRNR
jgi:hypothetical protein